MTDTAVAPTQGRKPARSPIGEGAVVERVRCAWRTLCADAVEPERVEVLTRKTKSSVSRLHGSGASGFPLIAKHARLRTAAIERSLYAEILPELPVRTLAWHGLVEVEEHFDGEAFCCFFVEDAGSARMVPHDAAHRRMAAEWLAGFHTAPVRASAASGLPDRGANDALERLQSGRVCIRQSLDSPTPPKDRAAVDEMLELLDELESRWENIEASCVESPRTLVHGDFSKKNASVRVTEGGAELLVYDFEHSGIGFPGQDLCLVDLDRYAERVREHWPDLNVARMLETGRFLRMVSSVRWLAKSLGLPGSTDLEEALRAYVVELRELIAAAGWGRA